MIFSRVRFILFFLSFAQSLWAIDIHRTPQAQIFFLQNAQKNTVCTATLFKPTGRSCALVTNAHCIGAGVTQVTITETFHGLPSIDLHRPDVDQKPDVENKFKVDVLKVSSPMDLAELEIPRELKDFYCSRLLPSPSLSAARLAESDIGVMATGYVNQKPQASMSGRFQSVLTSQGQRIGWPFAGTSQREVYATEIKWLPEVIKVRDLKTFRGMSGGAVIDQYKNFLGVNIWVRDQGIAESFFISVQSINEFLNGKDTSASPTFETTPLQQKLNPTGGNGHGDGGGNGHGDGGGNGHGDGGSRLRRFEGEKIKAPTDFFFNPEGIVDPRDNQQIIIGLNQQSVDGLDDYLSLSKESQKGTVVTKENRPGSFPSAAIREKILERFAGTFSSRKLDQQGLPQNSGRSSFFLQNANGDYIKDTSKTGEPLISLRIDSVTQKIQLLLAQHFLEDVMDERYLQNIPAIQDQFSVHFSPDAKAIQLMMASDTNAQFPVSCINDGYLKLNCSSGKMTLSLHLYKPGHIEFIASFLSESKTLLIHFYGDLLKVEP